MRGENYRPHPAHRYVGSPRRRWQRVTAPPTVPTAPAPLRTQTRDAKASESGPGYRFPDRAPDCAQGAGCRPSAPCLSFPIPEMGLGWTAAPEPRSIVSWRCRIFLPHWSPSPWPRDWKQFSGSVTRTVLSLFSSLLFLRVCVYT